MEKWDVFLPYFLLFFIVSGCIIFYSVSQLNIFRLGEFNPYDYVNIKKLNDLFLDKCNGFKKIILIIRYEKLTNFLRMIVNPRSLLSLILLSISVFLRFGDQIRNNLFLWIVTLLVIGVVLLGVFLLIFVILRYTEYKIKEN